MVNLVYQNPDSTIKEDFCEYIISIIQRDLIIALYNHHIRQQLNSIEQWINNPVKSPFLKDCYGLKRLDIYTILRQSIANISFKKYGETYYIGINKTKLIPGTFIPMEYLCNLVDDGNMDVTGTKIFTNVFRTVEVKFQEYFIAFLSGDYY